MPANPEQKEFVFPDACRDPLETNGRRSLGIFFIFLFALPLVLVFFGEFFDVFFETTSGTGKWVGFLLMIVVLFVLMYLAYSNLKTVVIRDGRVSIYNDESARTTPIYEAPYESFCALSVEYIPGGEGLGPQYDVFLHRKSNDRRLANHDQSIRLILGNSGTKLSMADREAVYELAEEMQIPVRDNPRKTFLSKLLS